LRGNSRENISAIKKVQSLRNGLKKIERRRKINCRLSAKFMKKVRDKKIKLNPISFLIPSEFDVKIYGTIREKHKVSIRIA